ncbi:hypothetical protein CWI38_0032p0080 [Hamiltosporidium tvaerminnensis]|uniref:Uncharacterized protein n=1 Tax=Hamiltosporidium tvaerminnensis TaxID=1176355 RepID=A0A4Q9L9F2_9MICR|nr:hypothetical protein LUQ84_003305 [Hamiltosporidium tvaerminnensis]TBU04353.1 hypothetical protein CWI37_0147p0010 [Hamiltosporidium tvaerminnensis]TBU20584.1 hypothetical protein CWI38_0048p0050 [Hamiltosporidium tvaerminnensis]TBU20703.1 hypothetical protein CWI38_0032p0080 [Hamiltosporidium tvaerminnensis]
MEDSMNKVSYGLIFLFLKTVLVSYPYQQVYPTENCTSSNPTYPQQNNFGLYHPNFTNFYGNIGNSAINSTVYSPSSFSANFHRFRPYDIFPRNITFPTNNSENIPSFLIHQPFPFYNSFHPYWPSYRQSEMFLQNYSTIYSETNAASIPPIYNQNYTAHDRLAEQRINPEPPRNIQVETNVSDDILNIQSGALQTNSIINSICSSSEAQRTFNTINTENEMQNIIDKAKTNNARSSTNQESGKMSESSNQDKICFENRTNTDVDNRSRTLENQIREMLHKMEKYIATANNLALIPLFVDKDSLQTNIKSVGDKIREFSMTRFRNSDKYLLISMYVMQRTYEYNFKNFKHLLNTGSINANNTLFPKCLFERFKGSKNHFSESRNKELEICSSLILSGLKSTISNFYPSLATNTDHNSEKNLISNDELNLKFQNELKNIEKNISNQEYFVNICSCFNDIEEKSFDSMFALEKIKNILKINSIYDILNLLTNSTQTILVYEIKVFLNLYSKDIEKRIKKNHVISMCFFLKALVNYFGNINLEKLYLTKNKNQERAEKIKLLRLEVCKKLFFVGKLFENLLRCLKNHETKANFYGLLNVCRFHNLILKSYTNDVTLFSLQIPLYISMILELSIDFDSETTIEFISFILFVVKQEKLTYADFYNDKFEYFLEKSNVNVKNIIKKNHDFTAKDNIYSQSTADMDNCTIIAKDFLDRDKTKNNKNRRLKTLYISQLNYMVLLKKKNLCFLSNLKYSNKFFEKINQRIEQFYGD